MAGRCGQAPSAACRGRLQGLSVGCAGGCPAALRWVRSCGHRPCPAFRSTVEADRFRVVDLNRYLLPGSVLLLALTQVPSACQSMAVLNCQRRFLEIAKTQEPIRESIAVQFCNGTSSGREAF